MCVGQAMGVIGQGGLLETLGDPLGTKRRRDEQQQNTWAREDKIRDATFAHEKELAGFNRGSMNIPSPGTGRAGVSGGQGGNKSRYSSGTGGAQSSKF